MSCVARLITEPRTAPTYPVAAPYSRKIPWRKRGGGLSGGRVKILGCLELTRWGAARKKREVRQPREPQVALLQCFLRRARTLQVPRFSSAKYGKTLGERHYRQ